MEKNQPFFVKGERDLSVLEAWLKSRQFTGYAALQDKKGNPMYGLNNNRDRAGLIVVVAREFDHLVETKIKAEMRT